MKVTLIAIGKTTERWIQDGLAIYENRIPHYIKFEYYETDDVKLRAGKHDPRLVMEAEAKKVSKLIDSVDHLVLLDENGKEHSSEQFATWFQKRQNQGLKHLAFLIGGPYGFAEELKKQSKEKVSLSKMTFSHQMVRVFAAEQIYRAQTILKGDPYHHSG